MPYDHFMWHALYPLKNFPLDPALEPIGPIAKTLRKITPRRPRPNPPQSSL